VATPKGIEGEVFSSLDRACTVMQSAECSAFCRNEVENRRDEHCTSVLYEWRFKCKFEGRRNVRIANPARQL
jgi:hypothetical protein